VKYRRIVARFGTSLLTAGSDRLDLEAMSRLVGQVARLRAAGCEVVVVSSGAQAAGRHRLAKWLQPGRTPSRQAFASVGQSHLMQSWDELFEWHDMVVAQVLLTRRDLADRLGYLNARNTLRDLIEAGTVPIVNENDAVALDQVLATRIGENDSLSAYVANLIDADLLVMLTDVDGLYDADPHIRRRALIERVERIDAELERAPAVRGAVGRADGDKAGGGADRRRAVMWSSRTGGGDILPAVASGDGRGTFFPAAASRLESRKRWILGSVSKSGHIVVDAGAAAALRAQGRSLLPAGVSGVRGAFDRGETVEVRDPEGQRVAAGMTNYGSTEIGRIRGMRSDRIAETLGYAYGDEVIHRG
jgi:glutamate 5-kinase